MGNDIQRRIAAIEDAWWGVHTSERFHPDGTSTMHYHAVHRHAGEHIGYLVETARALESALRALVDKSPLYARLGAGHWSCWYCDGAGSPPAFPHAPDCPWLAAKALVGE